MELLSKECIASVTLYDLRVSEGELMVFADSIAMVMKHFSDSDIERSTVCESREELSYYFDELKELLKGMVRQEYLPERFKDDL
ncbi:uncharacterized protein POS17_1571 [Pseudomonas sp. Os17]|uniref:hypothetical protein n=1 Tax=Pseudomonas TaxID=286 RepID=UPI0005FC5A3F|nr:MULTISPECIES: hypothetical protein [Pseudomonas]RXU69910.1 hypothetical protein CW358_04425 [Pseudomonas protegens]BAQ73265.1 uncharacterized protein POS17_1571 [Pseudomonas sp. Os17]